LRNAAMDTDILIVGAGPAGLFLANECARPIIEGPGKRYFDDSVRGGKGIRSRFLLVLGNDVEPSTTEAAKQLAVSLTDLLELRLASHPGIMLVRPDGYIGYATHSRAGASALAPLRAVLERQIQ
jgi:2-polyprenyl-6-methoxyphenol hydroxylase-like FAD-dependent oxidoreductase